MVIDCRRVLKYTYVFGYYLDPKKNKMKELFENLQEHLEKFTEQLSEMTELPVDQMDRTEIVNVTRVTGILPREPHQGHGERPRRARRAAARAGSGQVSARPAREQVYVPTLFYSVLFRGRCRVGVPTAMPSSRPRAIAALAAVAPSVS